VRTAHDGRDFVPTNKWVLFGHHFPPSRDGGPLVGPTPCEFGYLPGTLWLIRSGVCGCVQDFVILFCRFGATENRSPDGARRGQRTRGFIAHWPCCDHDDSSRVIGLVVVNALKSHPWATFTLAMTIPIALLLGLYLRFVRPAACSKLRMVASCICRRCRAVGGRFSLLSSRIHALSGVALLCIIVYGFAASALPVLVAARAARLSQRVHQGRRHFYSCPGILFVVRPQVLMPRSHASRRTGPVFARKIFPFCFITIACGAISGFHSLISSGHHRRR